MVARSGRAVSRRKRRDGKGGRDDVSRKTDREDPSRKPDSVSRGTGPSAPDSGSRPVWHERSEKAHKAYAERLTRSDEWRRARGTARRISWVWIVAIVGVVAIVAWLVMRLAFPNVLGARTLPAQREIVSSHQTDRAAFVGAERCAGCHVAEYEAWNVSTHARAGGAPGPGLVIAPFDGRPLRFANATVTPRVSGGTVWEFVVAEDGEVVRTYRVDGVVGGGHLEGGGTQGFVTTMRDGTLRFLPFDWSRQGRTWFCNTNSRSGRGWVPISQSLRLEDCGDWPPARVLGDLPRYANCQSCHASQLTVTLDSTRARWNTELTSLAINCESCHGPGRRHVALMTQPGAPSGADIGYRALATLDKDASLAVCYQCHAVKDQLRPGHVSGDSLAAFYSITFPLLGDRPLHADGRVRTFAYQESHQYSACYLNGGLTCTSCHDSHSQRYRDVTGAALQGRFDDRQCTSCHASKAALPTAHTHHAAGSVGSKCTACHMPYLQQPETRRSVDDGAVIAATTAAIPYERSDHSISIPRPALDSALGIRGACARCHAAKSTSELSRQVRTWWGEGKPMPTAIAAQLRFDPSMAASEAAPLLLGRPGDARLAANRFARFAGVSRLLETYGRPDAAAFDAATLARLLELAGDPDVDVRAIALATLHLVRGAEPAVRRPLAGALRAAGAHDAALRERWTLALGFMGDRFAGRGEYADAIAAYERALEVSSTAPRVLLGLANAQRDAGDPAAAVLTYRRSLAADPRQPITWVNLGIALGAAGDTTSAIDALLRATGLDAGEPLAWFNLANIHLVRGSLDSAAALYERAAALDPGLAVTHLRLARVWLLRKNLPAALRELRRGLAFDSTDATARQTAEALERALRGGGR